MITGSRHRTKEDLPDDMRPSSGPSDTAGQKNLNAMLRRTRNWARRKLGIRRGHTHSATLQSRYRSLFDHVPIALYLTAPDGTILDANPAMVDLLGYPDRDAVLELNAFDLYADRNVRAGQVEQIERDDMIRGHEIQLRRRNGSVIWVRDHARAVRDSAGRVKYYEGAFEDITEHKEMEDRLRQAQTLDAIGRLAGGIAHDFNNLLTAIIGNAELLLQSVDDDDALEDVAVIKKAGERAAELTSQLLAFGRRQRAEPQPLDLNAAVAGLGPRLQEMASDDIEFATALDENLSSVRADPVQLGEVIVALVENACEAMPAGGLLTIETNAISVNPEEALRLEVPHAGRYAVLSITDTGAGMDEQVQSQIFEPFFSTKSEVKGTGLGLATVYGIVKQSSGAIWVDSAPGLGTTFRVYLPAVGCDQEAARSGPARTPQTESRT